MISPHTALMFRVISLQGNVDALNIICEKKIARHKDLAEKMQGYHNSISHYLKDLLEMGLIEYAMENENGLIVKKGYKLTIKGHDTIRHLRIFDREYKKLVV